MTLNNLNQPQHLPLVSNLENVQDVLYVNRYVKRTGYYA